MGSGWLTERVPTKPSAGASQPATTQPITTQTAATKAAATQTGHSEHARPPSDPTDLGALSYEEARDELVAVVARLEAGGASLEESLLLWERGEALAARCQEWLDGARTRLDSARSSSLPTPDHPAEQAPADGALPPGGAR